MATTSTKRTTSRGGQKKRTATRRTTRKSKSTKPPARVSRERRTEVLGLILMTLSVLVLLAIISYNGADDTLARDFSFRKALHPAANQAYNALGLIGALIAWAMVPGFLGYPTVLLTALLFAWGYVTFRHHRPLHLRWYSGLTLIGTVLVSCFCGWITLTTESSLPLWSGALGLGLAGGLEWALGSIGSLLILFLFSAIVILVAIEGDIQQTFERIEQAVLRLIENIRIFWQNWQVDRAERREELMERRREAVEARIRKQMAEKQRVEKQRSSPAPEPTKPIPQARPVSVPPDTPVMTRNEMFRTNFQATPVPQSVQSATSKGQVPPAPPPASKPEPAPPTPEQPALHVREQVEEKKANLDERKVTPSIQKVPYKFPSVSLLEDDRDSKPPIDFDQLEENKQVLLDKLATYNIEIANIDAVVGPTVTLYELTPAPGVKISRIKALEDDLAMAMAARGIRMIAPIPGKSAIGVEIPNRYRELVRVRSLLNTERFRDAKMDLPIALGKTIEGEVFVEDLTKMPHLLIAGATGSGKSVGINNIIANLLYACSPDDLKFLMIDPKKIELQQYGQIFNHFIAMSHGSEDPITTDFADALCVLKSCLKEMEARYDLLSDAGVRSIKEYNKRLKQGKIAGEDHKHLPYLILVIDELADLMMTAGKDIEAPIARLAQMSRAVGIHLIVATQRPSVNVITGLIKANFPSRIAFQVASGIDSRTIIDQFGAEQLVGNGDFLYMNGSRVIRLQSPYISLEEVEALTQFIGGQKGAGPYYLPPIDDDSDASGSTGRVADLSSDDLFEEAAHIIVRAQQGSVSLLQRKLSVGYARAARLVDHLEQAGIVGPFEGSKARQVLVDNETELDALLKSEPVD